MGAGVHYSFKVTWSNYDILGIGDFVIWEISVWEAKAANIFVHFMNTFASLFVEVVV